MRYLQITVLVALFSLCISCSSHEIKKSTYSPDIGIQYNEKPRPMNISAIEQKIHRLTNEYRAKKGLPALSQSSYIDGAAREHSQYMRNQSNSSSERLVISHDNGKVRASKIMKNMNGISLGENVGALHRVKEAYVADKIAEGWITSKGHHKNIVGDYNHLGVGVSVGEDYTVFATQVFIKK